MLPSRRRTLVPMSNYCYWTSTNLYNVGNNFINGHIQVSALVKTTDRALPIMEIGRLVGRHITYIKYANTI